MRQLRLPRAGRPVEQNASGGLHAQVVEDFRVGKGLDNELSEVRQHRVHAAQVLKALLRALLWGEAGGALRVGQAGVSACSGHGPALAGEVGGACLPRVARSGRVRIARRALVVHPPERPVEGLGRGSPLRWPSRELRGCRCAGSARRRFLQLAGVAGGSLLLLPALVLGLRLTRRLLGRHLAEPRRRRQRRTQLLCNQALQGLLLGAPVLWI
mmetsp:Transcript_1104/g.3555  ORF Transcript_1104/g.3555 Transcript_1104/m.3555 type:complete len:213 (-) Transcript_1104:139-777(-)